MHFSFCEWMGISNPQKLGRRVMLILFFGAHKSFYPAGCINRSVHGGVGQ